MMETVAAVVVLVLLWCAVVACIALTRIADALERGQLQ